VLGSIGVALYRSHLGEALPAGVPADAQIAARDTLGGAVAVAGQLPAQLGAAVLETARDAFVQGMQIATTISAVVAVGVAILAVVMLRNVGSGADREAAADAATEQARDNGGAREPEHVRREEPRTTAPAAEAC
jgi:DHA2 family multidrug resistance protein-like MFS transporter